MHSHKDWFNAVSGLVKKQGYRPEPLLHREPAVVLSACLITVVMIVPSISNTYSYCSCHLCSLALLLVKLVLQSDIIKYHLLGLPTAPEAP